MSIIKPATPKALIESKLEMNKSELTKDFVEFVACLEKMDVIKRWHCHVVDDKKTGVSSTKNMGRNTDVGGRSSGHNPEEISSEGGSNKTSNRDRTKFGNERSSDSRGTGKQSTRDPAP
jgi:hypothetical protein